MGQVMRTLLLSPQFTSSKAYRSRIKSPVEFAVDVYRALNIQGSGVGLPAFITLMGQTVFDPPNVAGWPGGKVSALWLNKADNVVIMTWSEFGRRVEENGSLGTDHGPAAPMFVLGNPVNKGFFGEPPSLNNLDANGNLKYTTDFRSVYATILDHWLGASSVEVLGGSFGSQKFLPQP